MGTLYTGGQEVKSGIQYNGVVPLGNAFRLTDKGVKISINKSDFAYYERFEFILAHPNYSYSFEEDTIIAFAHVVTGDLSVIKESRCPVELDLTTGVESSDICTVDSGYKETTSGSIAAATTIENTGNKTANITIRLKVNGVLYGNTKIIEVKKDSVTTISQEEAITTAVAINSIVSFTIEADENNCKVITIPQISVVRIERTNA